VIYRKLIRFVASILICLTAGAVGSFFTSTSVNFWYRTLNKPSFNPPDWLFAPVWTTLYILMGISLYIILGSDNNKKRAALIVFSIQLALNLLWSAIFFGLRNPTFALIEIIFLWFSILVAIFIFRRISIFASILLVPYILWVSFAVLLNSLIVILN